MQPDKDQFGDRMKAYEALETERHLLPLTPICARLDGRTFHAFTKGLKKPFDLDFQGVMAGVTEYLVGETGARIGYTQSDEITLSWLWDEYEKGPFFNGRTFKISTVLAGMASTAFTLRALKIWPELVEARIPHFDCRVYNLPNEEELANAYLWREQDATKNAISMAAQAVIPHRQLHKKNGKEKQEMLFAMGVNFNDYPDACKRGLFVRRVRILEQLPEEVRLKIPEATRPPAGHMFTRSKIRQMTLPRLGSIKNRAEVLFHGLEPIIDQPAP